MRVYSVSQLNNYIKKLIDSEDLLYSISIEGELYDFRLRDGTAYFTLKDENAQLSCVFFGFNYSYSLRNGDKVICKGRPSFFVKGGKFSFSVKEMQPQGIGDKFLQLALLKERLQREGVFNIKRVRPDKIKRIGVITSADGAAIQDIISVCKRRDPSIDIVVYDVKVQGLGAEIEISEGIKLLSAYTGIDCIIVARGGGSNEDLSAFNTEEVARSVANSNKYIVSAVGHEIDYTLCDFAADMRVPTPSAAAEILTIDQKVKRSNVYTLIDKLNYLVAQKYTRSKILLGNILIKLEGQAAERLERARIAVISRINRITENNFLDKKTAEIKQLKLQLDALNPTKILKSGYAKIYKESVAVENISQISKGDTLKLYLSDGSAQTKVTETPQKFEIKE